MNFKMITEFDFIKKYLIFGGKNSKHSLNFTDDVGLVDNKIYSTDTICENIHFFSKDRPYYIAQKLIRVNVSDIISKGVKPKYCLFNFSVGKNIDQKWISNFMKGLKSDINLFKLNLIGWSLSRIDSVSRAILRSALYELRECNDIPVKVIINEYIEISKSFFEGNEPNFINGILDKISKIYRPNEF